MTPRVHACRFLVAIALSLLLHALALTGTALRVPAPPPPAPVLEARLLRLAPQPPAMLPPEPPPAKRAAPRPRVPPPPAPQAQPVWLPPPEPLPEAETAQPAPDPGPPAAEPPPSAAQAVAEAPVTAPPAAPARTLPPKGRITYTLHLGPDGFSVGRAVQTWEVEGNAYRLGSVAETTGLIDLFRSQRLNYLSEGQITEQGLRPHTFLMSRTRRGRTEAARAEFDWDAAKIVLGRVPDRRTLALPADSQDFISFMYQLALAPPAPGRIRVAVTNGSRLETYELDVLEHERIDTPLGTLNALPIKQVRRAGDESIEVWLAAEYRYLPVRVRFIDREGHPAGEQIASEILISEQ